MKTVKMRLLSLSFSLGLRVWRFWVLPKVSQSLKTLWTLCFHFPRGKGNSWGGFLGKARVERAGISQGVREGDEWVCCFHGHTSAPFFHLQWWPMWLDLVQLRYRLREICPHKLFSIFSLQFYASVLLPKYNYFIILLSRHAYSFKCDMVKLMK